MLNREIVVYGRSLGEVLQFMERLSRYTFLQPVVTEGAYWRTVGVRK